MTDRTRIFWIVSVVVLVIAAVVVVWFLIGSDESDKGDKVAFCSDLKDGVGLDSSAQTLADYEKLFENAPPGIRGEVEELRNTKREIDEIIKEDDLAALFDRSFSEEAEAAQIALKRYSEVQCV